MSFFNRRKRNRANSLTRAARAAFEQLEQRQLLTTTVEFTGFAPPAIEEGQSATFTMIRYESNEDYSNPLTVNLTFQGMTIGAEDAATGADVDAPTTATFAAGQQETSFVVTAIDDDSPEGNEWFRMSIASGGYDVGSDFRMTAIIESDVPIVWLTTAATGDDAPREGDNQPLRFVAHRDNTEGALPIWFYAGSFDLVEGQDYTLPGTVDPSNSRQTLTFADGQSTLNIDVTVIDDQDVESTQNLTLGLYGASPDLPAGAGKYRTLGSDPQQPDFAEGQIRDNDFNAYVTSLTVSKIDGDATVTTDGTTIPDVVIPTNSGGEASIHLAGLVDPTPDGYDRAYYKVVNTVTGALVASGHLPETGANVLLQTGTYDVLAGTDNNFNGFTDDEATHRVRVLAQDVTLTAEDNPVVIDVTGGTTKKGTGIIASDQVARQLKLGDILGPGGANANGLFNVAQTLLPVGGKTILSFTYTGPARAAPINYTVIIKVAGEPDIQPITLTITVK